MLTPRDKLLSGANDIIQIMVTTACDLYTCSNCTQLLPFRKDYRHMSLDVFEKAVKSLIDWPGVVSLFGGNPCSHPQFEDLCRILAKHIQPQARRGLWSNALLGHGEIVRQTFYPDGRFNLNVHRSVEATKEIVSWLPGKIIPSGVSAHSWHAPILMNYQDFGIDPDDWPAIRETCDINQRWSAAICERDGKPYAYFCEVAAALDGIRGMNHGMPLHYEWWKSPMQAYYGQVEGCCNAGCGVPLRGQGHLDNQETYDVSKSWLGKATEQKKQVVSLKFYATRPESTPVATDYLTRKV